LEQRTVTLSGNRCEMYLDDDFVNVRLPFAVDLARLSRALAAEGYHLAYDPYLEDEDSQGWGSEQDESDYYPYWVRPDPQDRGRSIFSFAPRDYDVGPDGYRPKIGPDALAEAERWIDMLKRASR